LLVVGAALVVITGQALPVEQVLLIRLFLPMVVKAASVPGVLVVVALAELVVEPVDRPRVLQAAEIL